MILHPLWELMTIKGQGSKGSDKYNGRSTKSEQKCHVTDHTSSIAVWQNGRSEVHCCLGIGVPIYS